MGRWSSSDEASPSSIKKRRRSTSRTPPRSSRRDSGQEHIQRYSTANQANMKLTRAPQLKAHINELRFKSFLNGCRRLGDHYDTLNKISEGSFGCVYRGCCKNGDIVALKRIKFPPELRAEGFPIAALREISSLLELRHPNVIEVAEIVVDDHKSPWMVMEYIEHELCVLLKLHKPDFSVSERKRLLLEILEGVNYFHSKGYIHRDLKTANILYANSGLVKICDFGLAKKFLTAHHTAQVATLWYRAPECLMGAGRYDFAMDMWAVGCIFAEIWLGHPVFKGTNPQDTMTQIVDLLGSPTVQDFAVHVELVNAGFRYSKRKDSWQKVFPPITTNMFAPGSMTDLGRDLLKKLLCWDPSGRLTAAQALEHPFFKESPLPQNLAFMPSVPETNDSLRHRRDEADEGEPTRTRHRVNATSYLNDLANASRN